MSRQSCNRSRSLTTILLAISLGFGVGGCTQPSEEEPSAGTEDADSNDVEETHTDPPCDEGNEFGCDDERDVRDGDSTGASDVHRETYGEIHTDPPCEEIHGAECDAYGPDTHGDVGDVIDDSEEVVEPPYPSCAPSVDVGITGQHLIGLGTAVTGLDSFIAFVADISENVDSSTVDLTLQLVTKDYCGIGSCDDLTPRQRVGPIIERSDLSVDADGGFQVVISELDMPENTVLGYPENIDQVSIEMNFTRCARGSLCGEAMIDIHSIAGNVVDNLYFDGDVGTSPTDDISLDAVPRVTNRCGEYSGPPCGRTKRAYKCDCLSDDECAAERCIDTQTASVCTTFCVPGANQCGEDWTCILPDGEISSNNPPYCVPVE